MKQYAYIEKEGDSFTIRLGSGDNEQEFVFRAKLYTEPLKIRFGANGDVTVDHICKVLGSEGARWRTEDPVSTFAKGANDQEGCAYCRQITPPIGGCPYCGRL